MCLSELLIFACGFINPQSHQTTVFLVFKSQSLLPTILTHHLALSISHIFHYPSVSSSCIVCIKIQNGSVGSNVTVLFLVIHITPHSSLAFYIKMPSFFLSYHLSVPFISRSLPTLFHIPYQILHSPSFSIAPQFIYAHPKDFLEPIIYRRS